MGLLPSLATRRLTAVVFAPTEIGVEQAFGSDVIDVAGKTRDEVSLGIINAYVHAGLPNAYAPDGDVKISEVAGRRPLTRPTLS
jgi:hypothetical protein